DGAAGEVERLNFHRSWSNRKGRVRPRPLRCSEAKLRIRQEWRCIHCRFGRRHRFKRRWLALGRLSCALSLRRLHYEEIVSVWLQAGDSHAMRIAAPWSLSGLRQVVGVTTITNAPAGASVR